MKYILTYQLLNIDDETISSVYELNKKYCDHSEVGVGFDKKVAIYECFLPQKKKHYLLAENGLALHLGSEIENPSDFLINANKRQTELSKTQANFRIVQDFAWGLQPAIKEKTNAQKMILVYVYEICDEEYIKLCRSMHSCDPSYLKMAIGELQEKHKGKLTKSYFKKQIYFCNELPKTARLIGIFSASSGVQNKFVVLLEGAQKQISEGEKIFINAVKCALFGYKPRITDERGVHSYNDFKIPVVNLKNHSICVGYPNDGACFEDAMLISSLATEKLANQALGCTGAIMKSLGKTPQSEPDRSVLQSVREQQDLNLPIIHVEEKQRLFQEFVILKKQMLDLQEKVEKQKKLGEKVDQLQSKQDVLLSEYYQRKLVNFEKDYIDSHIELQAFYRRMQLKLTEFLLACKVVSSEVVARQSDKVQDALNLGKSVAKFVCSLGGKALGVLPGGSFAVGVVDTILQGGFVVANTIHARREDNLIKQISALTVSLTEMDQNIEEISRKLSLIYERQIRCLTVAVKKTGINGLLAKGNLVLDSKNGGAEDLAEAAVAKIIDSMRSGVIKFQKECSIATEWLKAIACPLNVKFEFTLFGKSTLSTKVPNLLEKWNSNGVFQKSGIQVETGYYVGRNENSLGGKPEKYGYRIDLFENIKTLGLFKQKTPIVNAVGNLIKDVYSKPNQDQLVPQQF